jgi:PPOX class probable F420-dependent enzyme
MRTLRRLTDLQYRVLDGVRDRGAVEAARRPGTATDFSALRGARQCLVVSFKRSGEPVPTPVNFGLASDRRLYFRSEPTSAKMRRIRNDPHVRVCPCNLRGKPTGAATEANARVVDGAAAERADAALSRNWTPAMKLGERALDRLPLEMAYVEVRAV